MMGFKSLVNCSAIGSGTKVLNWLLARYIRRHVEISGFSHLGGHMGR